MASLANVTVGTTSTALYAGGKGRLLSITNFDTANFIVIKADESATAVTLSNGRRLGPGASWDIPASWFGSADFPSMTAIASTAACSVGVMLVGGDTAAR